MKTCSAPSCFRRVHARDLCQAHYIRLRRGQPLEEPIGVRVRVCSIRFCGRAVHGLGLCSMHYQRLRRIGSVGEAKTRKPQRDRTCTVAGCSGKHAGRGYCAAHLNRTRRLGSPLANCPVQRRGVSA